MKPSEQVLYVIEVYPRTKESKEIRLLKLPWRDAIKKSNLLKEIEIEGKKLEIASDVDWGDSRFRTYDFSLEEIVSIVARNVQISDEDRKKFKSLIEKYESIPEKDQAYDIAVVRENADIKAGQIFPVGYFEFRERKLSEER